MVRSSIPSPLISPALETEVPLQSYGLTPLMTKPLVPLRDDDSIVHQHRGGGARSPHHLLQPLGDLHLVDPDRGAPAGGVDVMDGALGGHEGDPVQGDGPIDLGLPLRLSGDTRRRSSDVEGSQRQLGSGLPDGLGGQDSYGLP